MNFNSWDRTEWEGWVTLCPCFPVGLEGQAVSFYEFVLHVIQNPQQAARGALWLEPILQQNTLPPFCLSLPSLAAPRDPQMHRGLISNMC